VNTQQHVQFRATAIGATVALAAALAVGGAAGYTVRGSVRSRGAAAAESAPTRIANPGIGLHRADGETQRADLVDQAPVDTSDLPAGGPVGAKNPGIGLHRAEDAEGQAIVQGH